MSNELRFKSRAQLFNITIVYESGCSDDVPFEATSLEDAIDQIIKWLPESRDAYQMSLINWAVISELGIHRLDSNEKTGRLLCYLNVNYFAPQNHRDKNEDHASDRWLDGSTLDGSPHLAMEGVA